MQVKVTFFCQQFLRCSTLFWFSFWPNSQSIGIADQSSGSQFSPTPVCHNSTKKNVLASETLEPRGRLNYAEVRSQKNWFECSAIKLVWRVVMMDLFASLRRFAATAEALWRQKARNTVTLERKKTNAASSDFLWAISEFFRSRFFELWRLQPPSKCHHTRHRRLMWILKQFFDTPLYRAGVFDVDENFSFMAINFPSLSQELNSSRKREKF